MNWGDTQLQKKQLVDTRHLNTIDMAFFIFFFIKLMPSCIKVILSRSAFQKEASQKEGRAQRWENTKWGLRAVERQLLVAKTVTWDKVPRARPPHTQLRLQHSKVEAESVGRTTNCDRSYRHLGRKRASKDAFVNVFASINGRFMAFHLLLGCIWANLAMNVLS